MFIILATSVNIVNGEIIKSMLYETFNANKESFGENFFTSRLDNETF